MDKINTINVFASTNKANAPTLSVSGEQLVDVFPGMVDQKNGQYYVSQSDFGLMAIKAIQEQQDLIEKLERKN